MINPPRRYDFLPPRRCCQRIDKPFKFRNLCSRQCSCSRRPSSVSSLPNPEVAWRNLRISLSERSLIHSIRIHLNRKGRVCEGPVFRFEKCAAGAKRPAAFLAQEGILLPQFLARLEQSLRRRTCFANESDLPEKLADLFVVARADRSVGPAWIADIDAEMLHR